MSNSIKRIKVEKQQMGGKIILAGLPSSSRFIFALLSS